ncbi:MAG: sigma-70 family RNA polymerase sigma factor [Ignavibacteriales bacterium]|nr:sigma-70 family RNA polymerase sigma factor [Ignavibacteriales bacterium]
MENEDLIFVTECLKGNGKAFEKIVDKYQKIIFRLADKLVRDFDDAEEITQSVFVKAYENLKDYNPQYKFFSWLYRIAVNESINFKKRKSNVSELNENETSLENDPDKICENNILSENINDALMQLDMLYRLPVVLKHFWTTHTRN